MPKISCEECVEADKNIPEERISERMCEQREVIDVTEFSSQDRSLLRTVDQMLDVTKISRQDLNWQRTVEQFLDDTRREPLFSRIAERIRELKESRIYPRLRTQRGKPFSEWFGGRPVSDKLKL